MEAKLEHHPLNVKSPKKSKPLTPFEKEKRKIAADRAKSYLTIDPTDRAVTFYNTFDGLIDQPIIIEKELLEYVKAIYKHHKKPLPDIKLSESPKRQFKSELNPKNALITFSGGTDSVASVIWALKKGYTIYLLHLYGLNKSATGFECAAVFDTAKTLGLENNLIVIKHFINGKKSTNNEFLENPAKNQYLYLLALSYMAQYHCGTMIASGQDDGHCDYFSDTKESYTLFYPYAESIIGTHQCLFPFLKKESYIYTLMQGSHLPGKEALMFQVNSCFSRRLAGADTGCSLIRSWANPSQLTDISTSTKAAYIRTGEQLLYRDKVTKKFFYNIPLSSEELEQFDTQLNTMSLAFGQERILSAQERILIHKLTKHYSNTNECGRCSKCKKLEHIRGQLSSITDAPQDQSLIIPTANAKTASFTTAKSPTFFHQTNNHKRKREEEESDLNERDTKRMNLASKD